MYQNRMARGDVGLRSWAATGADLRRRHWRPISVHQRRLQVVCIAGAEVELHSDNANVWSAAGKCGGRCAPPAAPQLLESNHERIRGSSVDVKYSKAFYVYRAWFLSLYERNRAKEEEVGPIDSGPALPLPVAPYLQ